MPLLEKLNLRRRGAAGPVPTNLNMTWGMTERSWLNGASDRAERLTQRFAELDRVNQTLAVPSPADPDAVQAHAELQQAIAQLRARSIQNHAADRQRAIAEVEALTARADKLALFRHEPNAAPESIRLKDVADDPDINGHLFADPQRLARLLRTLPETPSAAGALDDLESRALNAPNSIISREAHEALFTRKTEMLETAVADTVERSNDQRLAALKGLPNDQYWTMLIDEQVQATNNKHVFEQSQGYMAGMMSGLNCIVERIDEPLSRDFLEDLHRASTRNVTGQSVHDFIAANSMQQTGLKQRPNTWFMHGHASSQATDELAALRDDLQQRLDLRDPSGSAPRYFAASQLLGGVTKGGGGTAGIIAGGTLETVPLQRATGQLIDISIETYKAAVQQARGDKDAVLNAIIDCCRSLGMIHPFQDANGRVIMLLVLNKLLLENGMPPTTLPNQGLMIGTDRASLAALIRDGQAKMRR